jgi:hypothetical protein
MRTAGVALVAFVVLQSVLSARNLAIEELDDSAALPRA